MADPKQEKKEQEWGDRIPEETEQETGEKTYRDGSLINECWNEKSENK